MKTTFAFLRFIPFMEAALILFLLALLVSIQLSPANPLNALPLRDSGVFLYSGQQVLQGKVPYLDFWDHKGPLIFYINALGLWLGRGLRWGVFLLEWLLLFGGTLLGYLALRKFFGKGAALLGTAVWLFTLPGVLQGGNLTEEYSLFFTFLSFFLFTRYVHHPRAFHLTGIGLCLAANLLLRPNNAAFTTFIILGLLAAPVIRINYAQFWRRTGLVAAGLIIGLTPFLLYFLATGAFDDMISAYLTYNFNVSLGSRRALHSNPVFIVETLGVSALILLGSALAVGFRVLRQRQKPLDEKYLILWIILLAGISTELALILFSSNLHGHYLMSWLPYLAAFTASLYALLNPERFLPATFSKAAFRIAGLVVLILAAGYIWKAPVKMLFDDARTLLFNRSQGVEIVSAHAELLRTGTTPQDTVLIWGANPDLNFLSRRAAPTRYAYQYPLFTPGYATSAMLEEFLTDLKENPPVIILDTYNPRIPPINPARREEWLKSHTLENLPPEAPYVVDWISEHYRWEQNLHGWDYYRLKTSP